jgi:hypothetical protein
MSDDGGDADSFEEVGERFPELDDAARMRVAARMAAGTGAHEAFAQESVVWQLVRVYN